MTRYNAAHTGAEQEVFPFLPPRGDPKRPVVVAYTATRWGALLRPPSGFDGPPMSASDCYRFCLSHPDVDIVLQAPANRHELEENLEGMSRGPITPEEDAWMRDLGRRVRGGVRELVT